MLKRRLSELAEQCWHRNIPVFSCFLNLNEQTVFHAVRTKLPPVTIRMEGGYEAAERKIVCFLPVGENGAAEEVPLPLCAVRVCPKSPRFAGTSTHRDYLGAVLHLGIDRSQIGDILLTEQRADILCREQIAPFITQELTYVRHDPVFCRMVSLAELSYTPRFREVTGSLASVRLDSLIGLAFGLSRSKAVECIRAERVFVNGRQVLSPSFEPEADVLISVRKLGKFRYRGVQNQTRKGRESVLLELFQ